MARILVIDDDEDLIATLEMTLRGAGHTVTTAGNGLKAARLFRTDPFDLILTDIVMPEREGLETVIELRREFPMVAVIAISGGTTGSKMYLGMAARLGAHGTLDKPFTPAQLAAAVAAALAARDAADKPAI